VKRGKKDNPIAETIRGRKEGKWYKERMERMNKGRKKRYMSKKLDGTERAAKLQIKAGVEEIKGTPIDCEKTLRGREG